MSDREGQPADGRVPTADGIRGFAILLVVFGHLALITRWAPPFEPLPAVRSAFHLGVDLMFLVSGFLLFLPVVRRGSFGGVRRYALRRIGRILPGYYLVLVLSFALLPLLRGAYGLGDAPTPGADVVLSHVFLLEWQLFPGETGFRVAGSVWMVCVILPFYVVLPFIAERYLRHPWVGLVIGLGVAAAWNLAFGADLLPQVLSFADDFAVGMTAAWLYVRLSRDRPGQAARWASPVALLSAGVALLLAYAIGLPIARGEVLRYAENPILSGLLALALGAFVVSTAFATGWLRAVLANRAARWTGDVSYGVFLFHGPLTVVAMKLGFPHDGQTSSFVALAAFVIPTSFLAGWLMLNYFERPLRRRLDSLGAVREPAPAPSVS